MEDLAFVTPSVATRNPALRRLLLFNLATDEDDPLLGFTAGWIRALASRIPSVDVVTMRAGAANLPDNVRLYSIGKERGWSEARRLAEFYRRLGHLLHENAYDACFAHMQPRFALLAAPLLKPKGVPITLWYTHPDTAWALRAAVRAVDRVITADPNSCRVRTPKLLATGHGIDTDRFVPAFRDRSKSCIRILAVGRLAPCKRLDLLLDAVARLEGRLTQTLEVRIIGPTASLDAPYEASLRRQAAELASNTTFLGPRRPDDLIPAYQAADMVVSLTGLGFFDKSALEAMSCGVPLLTMNPAFAPHLAAAGSPGPIADGNALELANAIERVASAPVEERRQWGLGLRDEVIRAHSLQRLADLLVDKILCPAGS